jgi:hypothetical protein
LTLALCLIALALALQPVIWALVFFIALQLASAGDGTPPTQPSEDQMSQAVKDAFAAYVAFRDAGEAKAVADAVAAEQANHQAEIDAAKAAGAQAESDEDVAVIAAAMPAPEPAPEG